MEKIPMFHEHINRVIIHEQIVQFVERLENLKPFFLVLSPVQLSLIESRSEELEMLINLAFNRQY